MNFCYIIVNSYSYIYIFHLKLDKGPATYKKKDYNVDSTLLIQSMVYDTTINVKNMTDVDSRPRCDYYKVLFSSSNRKRNIMMVTGPSPR